MACNFVCVCVFPVNKPSITAENIRMIKPEELEYEYHKVPFMKTSTSQLYRGKYHGFQVAIKRFMDPANTDVRSDVICTLTHSRSTGSSSFEELQDSASSEPVMF